MPFRLDYRYYPFIITPRDYPRLFVDKPSIVVSENRGLREKVIEAFKYIVENGEVQVELFNDLEESVLVYYTIADLAKSIGDKRLLNRVAVAYSKTASKQLEVEKDEVLHAIAVKLGLSVRLETSNPPRIPLLKRIKRGIRIEFVPLILALPISEYTKITSKRLQHDPAYSLVNNVVHAGYIYLERRLFRRILEEYIYQLIISHCENTTPPSSEAYLKLLEEAGHVITGLYSSLYEGQLSRKSGVQVTEERVEEKGVILEHLFPPCMKKVLDIVNSGGNPSHIERFNLAAFLGNIGLDVDTVLDYFRKTADYNEKIARYQVEHILGLRGGRKMYKPHNCENLKTMGLCPILEQCPGGKNPLAVYRYNVRRLKHSRNEEQEKKPPAGFEPASTGYPDEA